MSTCARTGAALELADAIPTSHGGVCLFDTAGWQYLDWSSQASGGEAVGFVSDAFRGFAQ